MLETEFEYGRRLVREAQARTLEAAQAFPIEYRLMGPWLWQYRESGCETRVEPAASAGIAAPSASLEAGLGLLYHPAFRGWFAEGDRLLRPAAAILARMPGAQAGRGALTPDDVTRLTRQYFGRSMTKRIQSRLKRMGEWLERAGEGHTAALAWASAEALDNVPPERHPLARAMVELGLQTMVEQLRSLR
jgi:hypothetical protein